MTTDERAALRAQVERDRGERMQTGGILRLAAAIQFAAAAHAGQVYRGYGSRSDEPYILHTLRVALAVSPEAQIVAVLHDCLEDHGELPDWLTEAERLDVEILTRDKEQQTYREYILGIGGGITREVKIADLRDNLAHNPPSGLRERYEDALDVLDAGKAEPEPKHAATFDEMRDAISKRLEAGEDWCMLPHRYEMDERGDCRVCGEGPHTDTEAPPSDARERLAAAIEAYATYKGSYDLHYGKFADAILAMIREDREAYHDGTVRSIEIRQQATERAVATLTERVELLESRSFGANLRLNALERLVMP